jgi:DNA-binding NtrC family response regulator
MMLLPQTSRVPHLLVVEDELAVQAALKKYFVAAGFDVDCAGELEEAEALLATGAYDVVIADLRLSRGQAATEGLEILRYIRRHSRGTRVVVLSAHAGADLRHCADSLGAAAFLQKPMSLPQIAATVARVLKVAR